MAINTLFKKEIVSDGGKLTVKQRRFAYSSIAPVLLYMGLFTLFPIVFAMVMVFVVREMALPVLFCGFAFSSPVRALWDRYYLKLNRNKTSPPEETKTL